MCDGNDSDTDYMHIKINNENPSGGDDVVLTLICGSICVLIVGGITSLIHKYCSKQPVNLYSHLQKQHIISSVYQLIASTAYYLLRQSEGITTITTILYQAMTYFNLLIPIWTTCIALKMFSDLYIFNGAEVYTTKEVTKFAHGSVIVIEAYEELLLYYYYLVTCFHEFILIPAIRSTSVLLVMSAAIVIFIFIFVHLIKSSRSDFKMALFFFIHLFILLSCDSVLVMFKVHSSKPSGSFYIDAILLSTRLVLEMIWWAVTMFINNPLSGAVD